MSVILSNIYLDKLDKELDTKNETIYKVANSRLGWYKRSSMRGR